MDLVIPEASDHDPDIFENLQLLNRPFFGIISSSA
jgi:hypothetical protein